MLYPTHVASCHDVYYDDKEIIDALEQGIGKCYETVNFPKMISLMSNTVDVLHSKHPEYDRQYHISEVLKLSNSLLAYFKKFDKLLSA